MDSKVTLIYRLLSSCRLDSDPFLTHMTLQLPCVYYLFHILYYILPLLRIGRFSKRFSQHRPARQIQPVSHILLPFILFLCIVYWLSILQIIGYFWMTICISTVVHQAIIGPKSSVMKSCLFICYLL